jgi:hypothetical protein
VKTRTWVVVLAVTGLLVASLMVFAAEKKVQKEGKAFIGIVPGEVTSSIADDYGVKPGQGVVIEGVSSDSPAEKVGLRENDVIIRVNSAPVTGPQEFRDQISKLKPGDKVSVTYLRGGKEKTADVELESRHEWSFNWGSGRGEGHDFGGETQPWQWEEHHPNGKKVAYAGIEIQTLSDGLARYFKVDKGVLISEVVKDSPAEKAGLKAGDVIVKIGDKAVEGDGEVRGAIRSHKSGEAVDFIVNRDGKETAVKVTLGDQDLGDSDRLFFRFGDSGEEGDGSARVPSEAEMNEIGMKVGKALEELEIEIPHLSDSIAAKLHEIHIPDVRVKVDKSEPIIHRVRVVAPDASDRAYI